MKMLKTDVVVIGAGASNLKAMAWEKLPAGLYPFAEVACPDKAEFW